VQSRAINHSATYPRERGTTAKGNVARTWPPCEGGVSSAAKAPADERVACWRGSPLHRLFACALLVLACTSGLRAQPRAGPAPADEYFGRMKMSVLGIRNGLNDTALRIAYDPRHAASRLAACRWLENAIEDWGDKYPRDAWLPGMILALEHLYMRIHTAGARSWSAHLLAWVHRHYRGSHFERIARIAAR